MKRWILRTLIVTTVIGAFAFGRGLRANAETPASDNSKAKGQFICAHVTEVARLQSTLNDQCDSSKSFTTSFVPGPPGIVYCCVRK